MIQKVEDVNLMLLLLAFLTLWMMFYTLPKILQKRNRPRKSSQQVQSPQKLPVAFLMWMTRQEAMTSLVWVRMTS